MKKHGPLKIKISGIDCMNDNYTKTNVLYANAELINSNNEISLQKIADDLADYFYQRGNFLVLFAFIIFAFIILFLIKV